MQIKQINNLRYRYNKNINKWQVIAPNKKVLDEFVELGSAIVFMEETFDFCSRRTIITAIKRKIKELNGFIDNTYTHSTGAANFSNKKNAQKFQDYCAEIYCIATSTTVSGYRRYYIYYKVDK